MSLQEPSHNLSTPPAEHHARKRPASERKLLANRQNALKSTGPKTLQGKFFSRKNSLKHGFYAKDLRTAFPVGIEDPRDFEKLLAGLQNEWQPVGVSEESEVQQIAVSLWKRKRQWHFENADQRLELLEVQGRKGNSREDAAVACLLVKAEEQVETIGEISQELKNEIFPAAPWLREIWPQFEDISRMMALELERAEKEGASKSKRRSITTPTANKDPAEKYSEQRMARFVGFQTVEFATEQLRRRVAVHDAVLEAEYRQRSIPDIYSLNRILRYSGMNEKNLTRAYERLERLQLRRKGEFVPPSVNLNVNA